MEKENHDNERNIFSLENTTEMTDSQISDENAGKDYNKDFYI